jgi:hypothetical protein
MSTVNESAHSTLTALETVQIPIPHLQDLLFIALPFQPFPTPPPPKQVAFY